MSRFDVLFVDIGGVCLTNGWDTDSRRAAAAHFALDFEEMECLHRKVVEPLERGELSLHDYLDRVVFHTERGFARETFLAFMQAQSQPHGPVLDLFRRIAAETSYVVATIKQRVARVEPPSHCHVSPSRDPEALETFPRCSRGISAAGL